MKPRSLRTVLECLSFGLWMVFTIFSISLAGLGLEEMIFAGCMLLGSSAQPVHFPFSLIGLGSLGVFLSIAWRQVGIDHLHYLQYDAGPQFEGQGEAPSDVLNGLIREVENSAGYARTEARAKAKAWLLLHVSSLDEEDILLAKNHFGYLLPAKWGSLGDPPH